MKKVVTIGSAIALLLAGVASSAHAAPAAPTHSTAPPIAWGPCADESLQQAGAVCGMLSVPLDYNHPQGAKIQLAVSMVKHTTPASKYQGVMITNPGGPGGSGQRLSTQGH
jgi:hypothetical protein